MNQLPRGNKGGSSTPRTPYEMPDNLISINKIKILLAVSDGELFPGITGQQIMLDGTPVLTGTGEENFPGFSYEFRPGTQTQDYIKGFTDTSNEVTIARPLTTTTPYSLTVTNRNLSAIRFKMMTDRMVTIEEDGDQYGSVVEFAFDMAVNGGAYTEVLRDKFSGKTTKAYDRSIRINLPASFTQVIFRVRRITPDSTTSNVVNAIRVQSYAEVVDAKFKYPLTGLLYCEFTSDMFPNKIPTISINKKLKIVKIPSNYNPDTRTYTGTWNGTFKDGWTNNPAWVLYDLMTSQRYGLDQRELGIVVDKWSLYEAAQYCDQLVPNGLGGTEPRYLCDVVIQDREAAYQVIRDICSIFRGMSFYNGESISVIIDKKRDPVYLFTSDNVVDGVFEYTTASEKTRYSSCLVMFDDKDDQYNQGTEVVHDEIMAARYGNNTAEITAIGCTRRSEANRRGRWVIKTNQNSNTVSFATGLEGMIPMIGDVIQVSDPYHSGRIVNGRVQEVSGLTIYFQYPNDARPGDRIVFNRDDQAPLARTIASVAADKMSCTINVALGFTPLPDSLFAIEQSDLALQKFVVTKITKGEGSDVFTYAITGVEYYDEKYDEIDNGVVIDRPPTTVIAPDVIPPPTNVEISSFSRVVQGVSVQTMVVTWNAVQYASKYEMQWRKDKSNWINTPIASTRERDVEGIYAGLYEVRVRAITDANVVSSWSAIKTQTLTGKVGAPAMPTMITASTDEVFGITVRWAFATGSGDTAYTEIQQSSTGQVANATQLTMVTYPTNSYFHMPLAAGYANFYRVRTIDRIGNVSPWTAFARGQATADVDKIGQVVQIDIESSQAFKDLTQSVIENSASIIGNAEADIENALSSNENTHRITAESGERIASYTYALQMIANEEMARVTETTKLQATFSDSITSLYASQVDIIATAEQTTTQVTELIQSNYDANEASIAIVSKTAADANQATADRIEVVRAEVGENAAAISQKMTAMFNNEGTGSAIYSLNAGVMYNGVEYSAGMAIGVEVSGSSIKSQVLFNADRFAFMTGSNGEYQMPFFIERGQVFITSAAIQNASIGNAQISDMLTSKNFVAGQTGLMIDFANGRMENNGQGSGGRMTQSNNSIKLYDANGVLRVAIGEY